MNKNSSFKRKNIVFRQWSRKSYAVFNSLHKSVSIGVLLTAYSLVQSGTVFAQADTISQNKEPEQLDEVVVESEALPEVYSEVARVIQVITKDEINRLPVSNVYQLLDYAANVDIRTRSAAQADISIKGGTFDQCLVLINGIPVNDPQSGHHNLNLPFNLNDVEQIEILQGPASKIFGPNAYSGAVNFILNKKTKKYLSASAKLSDFQTKQFDVSAKYFYKKISQYISYSNLNSEGYIYNTGINKQNFYAQTNYQINDNSKITALFGFDNKNFGANSFYHWASLDQKEHIRNYLGALQFKTGSKLQFKTNIYFRKNLDKYYWKPEFSPNLTQTNILGFDLKSRFYSNLGKTDFGISVKQEDMLSNKMGENLSDSISVPFETNTYYYKGKKRQNYNVFIAQSGRKNNFFYNIGANVNYNSMFDFNYAGGIELAYGITSRVKPYVSVNSAFRLPTFFDLYYIGPSLGDTNLIPEQAVNFEGGVKLNNKILTGNISLFYITADNAIDWVKPDTSTIAPYKATNISHLNTLGIDISGKFKLNKLTSEYIKMLKVDIAFMNQEQKTEGYISKYAQTYLKAKISLTLIHKIYKNILASWNWVYKNREGYFDYYKTGEKTNYTPYNLLNARIFYSYKNVKLFVEARNIFNEYYFDQGSLPQPGRWFGGGISFKIPVK